MVYNVGRVSSMHKKKKKKNRESNFIAQTIVFQLFQSKADIIGKITLY